MAVALCQAVAVAPCQVVEAVVVEAVAVVPCQAVVEAMVVVWLAVPWHRAVVVALAVAVVSHCQPEATGRRWQGQPVPPLVLGPRCPAVPPEQARAPRQAAPCAVAIHWSLSVPRRGQDWTSICLVLLLPWARSATRSLFLLLPSLHSFATNP